MKRTRDGHEFFANDDKISGTFMWVFFFLLGSHGPELPRNLKFNRSWFDNSLHL